MNLKAIFRCVGSLCVSPSFSLFVYWYVCLQASLWVFLSVFLCVCPVYLSVCPTWLSNCLSFSPPPPLQSIQHSRWFVCFSLCLSCCLSILWNQTRWRKERTEPRCFELKMPTAEYLQPKSKLQKPKVLLEPDNVVQEATWRSKTRSKHSRTC